MFRLIIAGSRDFRGPDAESYAYGKLIHFLNGSSLYPKDIEFISGGANGADAIGESFARMYTHLGAKLTVMKADWDNIGRSAGYIRNEEMAKYASQGENGGGLVAFWDQKSKGTKNMIHVAKKYKLNIVILNYRKDLDKC